MGRTEKDRYTERMYLHVFVNVVHVSGVFSVHNVCVGKKCFGRCSLLLLWMHGDLESVKVMQGILGGLLQNYTC